MVFNLDNDLAKDESRLRTIGYMNDGSMKFQSFGTRDCGNSIASQQHNMHHRKQNQKFRVSDHLAFRTITSL